MAWYHEVLISRYMLHMLNMLNVKFTDVLLTIEEKIKAVSVCVSWNRASHAFHDIIPPCFLSGRCRSVHVHKYTQLVHVCTHMHGHTFWLFKV